MQPGHALSSTTCVVTGGLGFIGSNLAHALVGSGAEVRVVDALVDDHGGDRRNVGDIDVEIVEAEIGDDIVAEAVADADVVFNLAGQVSHLASMRDPLRDLHFNALTHAAFLETLRRVNPTARIVHTSTRQVYGRPLQSPVDELHPTRPVDVNGVAKLAGEQLHLVYHTAHGMNTTSLRLTNVFGPRQRLSSDQLGFLPVFIRKAMLGEEILIFGDGLQRRDCVFVDDVVDALLASTAPEAIGKVFNVGNVVDHSLAEIASAVIETTASSGGLRLVPWPEAQHRIDIGSFHTDGSTIAEALGWKATTSLDAGLRATTRFYREHQWYLSST
ncbi:MAG TPA: NAD-dependent epimerase/dehydratase family protein [Ilumatobacteraceae bacterium]